MNTLIIFNHQPYDGTNEATMAELAEWVNQVDRIITL